MPRPLCVVVAAEERAGLPKVHSSHTDRNSTFISILTYNIWNTNGWDELAGRDGGEIYVRRMAKLTEQVAASGADVVAFQEVNRLRAPTLR